MHGRDQLIGIVKFFNLNFKTHKKRQNIIIKSLKTCFIYNEHIIFVILNPKSKLDIKSMKDDDLKHF